MAGQPAKSTGPSAGVHHSEPEMTGRHDEAPSPWNAHRGDGPRTAPTVGSERGREGSAGRHGHLRFQHPRPPACAALHVAHRPVSGSSPGEADTGSIARRADQQAIDAERSASAAAQVASTPTRPRRTPTRPRRTPTRPRPSGTKPTPRAIRNRRAGPGDRRSMAVGRGGQVGHGGQGVTRCLQVLAPHARGEHDQPPRHARRTGVRRARAAGHGGLARRHRGRP